MKALFLFAATLAGLAEAREPEDLEALVDEMAVLERMLGAALESEISGLVESHYDLSARQRQTGMQLERWLQESVRTIKAEYLARQGILVSLHFSGRRSARDIPDSLLMTLARTAGTRWSGSAGPLDRNDFAALKLLVDELDETQRKQRELMEKRRVERDAGKDGNLRGPRPKEQEISVLQAREIEVQANIDKEIQRLRGILVGPAQEWSMDDIHGTLMQAVCDYAMLKSLPDDEHLTLKVGEDKAHPDGRRTVRQWTYYVLAKQDVVECRRGSIDAEELRQRADVYSLPHL